MYTIIGSNSIKEGEAFRFSAIAQDIVDNIYANFSLSSRDSDGNLVPLFKQDILLSSAEIQSLVFDVS